MRNSNRAIAARLAEMFDRAIVAQHVRPNLKGEYSFGMLKLALYHLLGVDRIGPTLRKYLKKCGYLIVLRGNEVEITKFR